MATVKYRIREFVPTANQTGGHSFYAESVCDNIIDNHLLAKKIEARGLSRAAEIKAILEEAATSFLKKRVKTTVYLWRPVMVFSSASTRK